MRSELLERLTPTSVIAELPGHRVALDGDLKARRLAELFQAQPALPGVLLTRHGRVYSAVSRSYYFETVGGYCGKDLYDGRPIHLMMERFHGRGGALVLAADVPIRAAVERGLARSRELLYEPIVVLEAPDRGFLVDFEDLLLADSWLSGLRQLQMRQILGSVGEGLLLIAADRRIGAEYSRSAETVLATTELAGRTLPEVLAGHVAAAQLEWTASYLDVLFRPHVIPSLVTRLNPLDRVELTVAGEPAPRVLTFRFTRSLVDGQVRHVLARVEDVTRAETQARELAATREASERRLALAVALVEAEPRGLRHFLARLAVHAEELRGLDPANLGQRAACARELHALKGEAGLLGLEPFRAALHELEDHLASPAAALAELGTLRAETRELVARFRRVAEASPAPRAEVASDDGLWKGLTRFVADEAAKLGKQARFVSRVSLAELPPDFRPLLGDTLVQLATNALVHGIEPPAVRTALGKPATGTLQLAARHHPERGLLELVFQDDGGGLDREALRARAAELGLSEPGGDPAQLLFHPGLSTARETTARAGRGVGLDLVKTTIESRGGRISVHSEPGRYCAFRLLLPRSSEVAA